MDFSEIFRIVNLATGALMIVAGVAQFLSISIQGAIVGVYLIVFGLGTGFLEFQIPPIMGKYASFMFSFIGRGVFYIFIGSVAVGVNILGTIMGAIIGVVGIAYAVLEFIPSIEPPANMRDADPSWGAEQI